AAVAPFIGGGCHHLRRRREGRGHRLPPRIVTDELSIAFLPTHPSTSTCRAAFPVARGDERHTPSGGPRSVAVARRSVLLQACHARRHDCATVTPQGAETGRTGRAGTAVRTSVSRGSRAVSLAEPAC